MVIDTKIDIVKSIFDFLHTSEDVLIANTKKRFHITKWTRCKHNTFYVFDGWNQNLKVTSWNQSQRIGS